MKVIFLIIFLFLIPLIIVGQTYPQQQEKKLLISKIEHPERLFIAKPSSNIIIHTKEGLYTSTEYSIEKDSSVIMNSDTILISEIEKIKVRYYTDVFSKLSGGFIFLSTTTVGFFGFGLAGSGIFVYPEAAFIAIPALIPLAGIVYFGYKYTGSLWGIRKFKTKKWQLEIVGDT